MKGTLNNYMICESFSIIVLSNTWWIDMGSMGHVASSLQGFHTKKLLKSNQQIIKVGDRNEKKVEAIGIMMLLLDGGHEMVLKNTLYIPTITRNLISISKCKYDRYGFHFDGDDVIISRFKSVVGFGKLEGDLYKLRLDNEFSDSLLSIKCKSL